MPVLYEGRCSVCDAVTERTSDGYLALSIDEPATTYAHPDDSHLVILAHPCESLILDEYGYTYPEAAWAGRLVRVQKVFCNECGCRFEIRRLSAGLNALGCGVFLGITVVAAAAAGVTGVLVGRGGLGYVGGYVTFILFLMIVLMVADSAVEKFVRRKRAKHVARVDTSAQCPMCGGQRSVRPGVFRTQIPCRECGRRAVRFRYVGKS